VTDFIDIAALADVPLGRARTFDAGGGRKIAVYRTPHGVFASDNTCPHRGGPLGEGDIIGNEIVCPWHLWGFDLVSGECAGIPGMSIVTHEVRVEGERIMVKLAPVRETTDRLL